MMNRFAMSVMIVFMSLLSLSVAFFTFQECGWKTFLYGNNAFFAAYIGLCGD